MRILGRTERRVVVAILVTALIPLVASILTARAVIARLSATAYQPEFGAHLERGLEVYADLATAIKQRMRAEADAIAAVERLRQSAFSSAAGSLATELEAAFSRHPALVSLRVETCDGVLRGVRDRENPVDHEREKTLTVRRALERSGAAPGDPSACADRPEEVLLLSATFATPSARFGELEAAQAFSQAYNQLVRDHREEYVDRTYLRAFAVLIGSTIVLAVVAGVLLVRPAVRKLRQLTKAMQPVAEGDLSVRVGLAGEDEIAELGRSFDHMLEELQRSRTRLEFLRRMSEWQKVARRLAHEIKNPLTPIQLAVQECHRRYRGGDASYERVLQTTLEVVEEEVGSLRRLVSEFASFARLPRPELEEVDLGTFLREQAERLDAASTAEGSDDGAGWLGAVDVEFNLPGEAMPVLLDREMFHRALTNMVRNAAQALRDARQGRATDGAAEGATSEGGASETTAPNKGSWGQICVSTHSEGTGYVIDVDDDGPGIDAALRDAIFDPYVTTRRDGTGLGLSIVKKIVVDHGGTIDVLVSPLGGARFEVRMPRAGSPEARAVLEQQQRAAEEDEAPVASAPSLR
ncbi:sensor histidine kinase [Chondromyces crocatus]|uniref:histidine kinase n=1 Tax=Chondromyces crocatus TaxID=52 RepID=A0A0K1E952_CHOCO|nr:ATP-binding protein [Chondromyces crocatus]AKT37093.1 histidine kinase [Chondromyces crocatus]